MLWGKKSPGGCDGVREWQLLDPFETEEDWWVATGITAAGQCAKWHFFYSVTDPPPWAAEAIEPPAQLPVDAITLS